MTNNERELASLTSDIKYLVKSIDEIKKTHSGSMDKIEKKLDAFIKEVEGNYSKKEDVEDNKKKIEWWSRTFITTIIGIIASAIVYYVTNN